MTPTTNVLEGHQRIRSLLRGLVATAARAREGDIEAAMSLGSFAEELRAEIRRRELPRAEADAAVAIRGVTNLEEFLAQVGVLVNTMSAVERELPTERTDA